MALGTNPHISVAVASQKAHASAPPTPQPDQPSTCNNQNCWLRFQLKVSHRNVRVGTSETGGACVVVFVMAEFYVNRQAVGFALSCEALA